MTFIKLAVSLLLIIFVLYFIDFRKLIHVILKINQGLLLAAFFLVVLMHIINCFRWRMCLLEQSNKIYFFHLILVYWKAMFVSLFMPTEYGGDVLRVKFLWNKLDNNKLALVSVFWSRVSGFLSMIILLLCVAPFFHSRYDFVSHNTMLMIAAIPLLLILMFCATEKLHQFVARYSNSSIVRRISLQMREVFALISEMATHKVYAWKIFLLSLISQIMMVVVNYIYAQSLAQPVDILDMLYFIPLLNIVSLLPITVGGLGLKEGAFVIFFSAIGITKENALAIALLNRSVLITLSLIGGLLFLCQTKDSYDK